MVSEGLLSVTRLQTMTRCTILEPRRWVNNENFGNRRKDGLVSEAAKGSSGRKPIKAVCRAPRIYTLRTTPFVTS